MSDLFRNARAWRTRTHAALDELVEASASDDGSADLRAPIEMETPGTGADAPASNDTIDQLIAGLRESRRVLDSVLGSSPTPETTGPDTEPRTWPVAATPAPWPDDPDPPPRPPSPRGRPPRPTPTASGRSDDPVVPSAGSTADRPPAQPATDLDALLDAWEPLDPFEQAVADARKQLRSIGFTPDDASLSDADDEILRAVCRSLGESILHRGADSTFVDLHDDTELETTATHLIDELRLPAPQVTELMDQIRPSNPDGLPIETTDEWVLRSVVVFVVVKQLDPDGASVERWKR